MASFLTFLGRIKRALSFYLMLGFLHESLLFACPMQVGSRRAVPFHVTHYMNYDSVTFLTAPRAVCCDASAALPTHAQRNAVIIIHT